MNEICGDNRFEIIAKAKAHLLDATNIDTSEDEMKVIDSFLFRCWQMGWLDRYAEQTEPQTEVETMSCAECKHRPIGAEICEEACHYEPQTDWHYDEQDATWYPYKHEDEPQQKSCATCKHALGNWDGESNNCGRCCGADRRFYEPKTEPNCSEKLNNSKVSEIPTSSTISKMEQVEPQTSCKTCRYGEVDEGYVRCAYYSKADCKTEPKQGTDCTQVDWKDEMWTEAVKDEPQTDCDHKCIQTEIGCEKPDCPWK